MNTDLSRNQSLHTKSLLAFAKRESLIPAIHHECSNVDYTFESKASGERSLLDHFIVSENLVGSICEHNVVHRGDNLSDHSPIEITMDISTRYTEDPVSRTESTHLMWNKANSNNLQAYKEKLDTNLSALQYPHKALNCCDYSCQQHSNDIEQFHDAIVSACLMAGDASIPKSIDSTNCQPGWNDFVKEHKNEALNWHKIWKSHNSPHTGHVATMRRLTRARYHYAVRYIKKYKESISADKLAEHLMSHHDVSFWKEIKNVMGVKTKAPNNIDNCTGDNNIGDLFAEKYKSLYNSVSYNSVNMSSLLRDIDHDIVKKCVPGECSASHVVSPRDVEMAICDLKAGKVDGFAGQCSDHLINGTNSLHVSLAQLFTCMLTHGFAPDSFLISTIISIPKNKRKSLNDSDNYRGIALSSVLGKVFDRIILMKNSVELSTSDLQFGFKPKHSTTQCTFVVDEVTKYYTKHGSNVFVMLLDATKAFDRVNYIKLFRLLLKRGLCPLLCRFLAFTYTKQMLRVRWGKYVSTNFDVSNGVKQGGVLSPVLFTVYIDELLTRLKVSGVGCHIGNCFMGALGYADDITLLTPTKAALCKMLDICSVFSREFDIKFNPSKCQLVVLDKHREVMNAAIQFEDKVILSEASAVHLGNKVGDMADVYRIKAAIRDMCVRTNSLSSMFNNVHYTVKYRLFKTFCTSCYGSQLWDLTSTQMNGLSVSWRKCIRKLLCLPYKTHCKLIPIICDDLPLISQLHQRFLKFISNIFRSSNMCLQYCALSALHGSGSATSKNLVYMSHYLGVSKYSLAAVPLSAATEKLRRSMNCSPEDNVVSSQITDLLDVLCNTSLIGNGFTRSDVTLMLEHLCCD